MPLLENFNPFVDRVPEWPIKQLDSIAYRASRLLSPRDLDGLRRSAREMTTVIEEAKQIGAEVRIQFHVTRLVEHGGWELKYYPQGQPATETGVRWLLDNWPEEAEEEPSVPDGDYMSDLHALTVCELYSESESNARLFALLATLKVEEILELLGWTKEHRWIKPDCVTSVSMSLAAGLSIEATDAVGYAALENEQAAQRALTAPSLTPMGSQNQVESPPPNKGKRRPPAEAGAKGRAAKYDAIKSFVASALYQALDSGTYQAESFLGSLLQEIPKKFTYRTTGRNGQKRGDPMNVKPAKLEEWIEELIRQDFCCSRSRKVGFC
jgi:hypothetical protein